MQEGAPPKDSDSSTSSAATQGVEAGRPVTGSALRSDRPEIDRLTPERGRPSTSIQEPSPPAPGAPHARVLGMTAFALGTVLALLTYLSAFSAFQAGVAKLQGRGFQPPTTYADWGMQLGFKFLALIVMAVAGWVIAGRGAQLHAAGCVARSDSMGKAIGILVFCGGIGLVTLVFLNTSHYFATTVIPKPANGTGASPDYAAWAIGGLIQIILLGIMAFIGSLVTGRGVQLFLGSFSTREKSGGD